jgi:5'-nucleotidase
MKILISNDDGIHANGINALIKRLAGEHHVYVVAPDRERSAMGHALTLHRPLRLQEVDLALPVEKAYAISGTPSDCVKIGLHSLLDFRPDLLLSGINHGPNLGNDVLYSGTVSAAIEGAMNGIPSIAVSLVNGFERHAEFTDSAEFIARFIPKAMALALPPKTILNVNIPALPLNEIAGVKLTQLGTRMYSDSYEKRFDPRGHVYYWLAGEVLKDSDEPEEADVMAIRNNYISITPVHFDMTHTAFVKEQQAQYTEHWS